MKHKNHELPIEKKVESLLNRHNLSELWDYCRRLGLNFSFASILLVACHHSEPISHQDILPKLNQESPQITEVVESVFTAESQPTLTPKSLNSSPTATLPALKSSETKIPELIRDPIPAVAAERDSSETDEERINDYFAKRYELSDYQNQALESIETGSMLEIMGVRNGVDLCPEPNCFRVPIRVETGLGRLSQIASGREIVGYKPESPVSDSAEGYIEGSEIISWPGEVFFNVHNRARFFWMLDSAWAELEALKEGDTVKLTNEQNEVFDFIIVHTQILPRSDDFYREAVSATAQEYGGARVFMMGCTEGGSNLNELFVATLIPVDVDQN
jgi:hypothetical protein